MPLTKVVSGVSLSPLSSSCRVASCQRSWAKLRLVGGGCSGLEACKASSRRLRWFEEGSVRVGSTAWCWSRPKPVKRRALDQEAQPRRIRSPHCSTQRSVALVPRTPCSTRTHRQLLSFGCATLAFGRCRRCGFALRLALHRRCGYWRRLGMRSGLRGSAGGNALRGVAVVRSSVSPAAAQSRLDRGAKQGVGPNSSWAHVTARPLHQQL